MKIQYEETHIIFNKIQQKTGLNDEAFALLNISKEKIDTAMHQCTSAGMSRKAAMRAIYKMWGYAEPDAEQNDSASPS